MLRLHKSARYPLTHTDEYIPKLFRTSVLTCVREKKCLNVRMVFMQFDMEKYGIFIEFSNIIFDCMRGILK